LYILTKKRIDEYKSIHHSKLKTIEPIFFAKLSLPVKLKQKRANEEKEKQNRVSLIKNIMRENKRKETQDLTDQDEERIEKASVLLEKMLVKIKHKKVVQFSHEQPIAMLSTNIAAKHQLEGIFNEPDFDTALISPRRKLCIV